MSYSIKENYNAKQLNMVHTCTSNNMPCKKYSGLGGFEPPYLTKVSRVHPISECSSELKTHRIRKETKNL